ncbi:MAG: SDR family NAD(P)-dependent oxidoreductase [Calditrichota bacterium]
MKKTILITGATDGIGFETTKLLYAEGHHLLIHGRNPEKLEFVKKTLADLPGSGSVKSYICDLSRLNDVEVFANSILENHSELDVLINNAGVFRTPDVITSDGLDIRFAVNTIAPYLLTKKLLPIMSSAGRVVNLSSAAQAPVNLEALYGRARLGDGPAYAQSKLAITMWSRGMALEEREKALIIVAVNPGSFLGSKMVKEAYGIEGEDLGIGSDILTRAALSEEFSNANGLYFDNDSKRFASPHPDALNPQKLNEIIEAIDTVLNSLLNG